MVLNILSESEPVKVSSVVVHIFGDPGVGKSTLGCAADGALVADFDRSLHRSLGRKIAAQMDAWSDLSALLASEELRAASCLTIDTVGRALDLCALGIVKGNAKAGSPATGLNIMGWGILKIQFGAFFAQARALGKDILILSHAKMERDATSGNKVASPDIPGGSAGEVYKAADAMGYMTTVNGRRVIEWDATDFHTGKNPAAWGPMEVPPYRPGLDFLHAGIFAPLKARLNQMTEAQTAVLAACSAWDQKVNDAEAAKGDRAKVFSALVTEALKVHEPPVRVYAKATVHRAATAAGLAWDSQSAAYVKAPAKAAETGA